MRNLKLSVIRQDLWRKEKGMGEDWRSIRETVLRRDGYTCFFCGFSCRKYMHVHHLEGYMVETPDKLVTVCPFCHSCLHIGNSGLNRLGVLLILSEEANQAEVNRNLLEGVRKSRSTDIFFDIYKEFPVVDNLGADGLVELANLMLSEKNLVIDNTFLFFPNHNKYDIVRYLLEGELT